jgi:hypothetical protein
MRATIGAARDGVNAAWRRSAQRTDVRAVDRMGDRLRRDPAAAERHVGAALCQRAIVAAVQQQVLQFARLARTAPGEDAELPVGDAARPVQIGHQRDP